MKRRVLDGVRRATCSAHIGRTAVALAAVAVVRSACAAGALPAGVADFNVTADPILDVAPIVSWTVTDGSAVTKTVVQTSYLADGDFADVSEDYSGAGSFAFTNTAAAVGAPLHYRLKCTGTGGETFSEPVLFRRVRQLERAADDQTKLADGVALLPPSGFTVVTNMAYGWGGTPAKSFDGDLDSSTDMFINDSKCTPTESVVGVDLPSAAHVTDIYIYPRSSTETRLSNARVLAATSRAELDALKVTTLAGMQTVASSPRQWYRYRSGDTNTAYRCVFAYDGALDGKGVRGWCGNAAEVRFYGWTLADEAALGLTVAAPTVSQDLLENTPPVVKWGFAGDVITSARLQYAEFPGGPWQDLGDEQTATGEFSFAHTDLLPGLPVYYRVAYVSQLDGPCASDVTSFRRLRQLERAGDDQSKLAEGVTTLPLKNYTVSTETQIAGGANLAFDGKTNTWSDAFGMPGYTAVETLVGVCLPDAAYVTDIFMYPRPNYVTDRLADVSVLACTSKEAFDAKETFELAPQQSYPDNTLKWYRYQPLDSKTPYQCLFAYSGPLVERTGRFAATVAEIRFYGWSLADEAAAGLRILPPQVTVANPLDPSDLVVSWQVGGTRIVTSQVEYSYSLNGPFVATGTEKSGAGSFDCPVTDAVQGLMAYYRIRYTMDGSDEAFFTEPTPFRRVRQLERDASDQTKLATGVTMLPAINYSTYNELAMIGSATSKAFDGDLATYGDLYERDTYRAVESVVGVCLPEAAHVTDIYMYPRDTGDLVIRRLGDAAVFACTSYLEFEMKETRRLAPRQSVQSVRWYHYQSNDSGTPYQCLFAYSGPLDVGVGSFAGTVAEIRFFGWTASDIANAEVLAPTGIATVPGVREVRLSWTEAVRADTVRVERRAAGATDWSLVAADVPATAGAYTDTTAAPKTAYEYRLVSVGLNGRMEAASEPVPVQTERPGSIIILR